ncbi:effector binding domain-containing protein [Ectobacillus ponti]|uniref:GyrI-like domain-containing protein n=1 Tax=Ectobacillus ponti TaxID=2961894 RepID=A0AA41X2L2_9BACI|nr:effector binding domain-containing protein [Ectobacillus ponti]MCP8967784.1 GyrI-like domain-containing protein [Ectobacillus ponti]
MKLKHLKATCICGREYETSLESCYGQVPGFYQDFKELEHYTKFPDLTPDQAYGIACRFQGNRFSLVIGGEVAPGTTAPEGFTIVELPAGACAVSEERGDLGGYERGEGPAFEVTDLTRTLQEQRLVITHYVPVKNS